MRCKLPVCASSSSFGWLQHHRSHVGGFVSQVFAHVRVLPPTTLRFRFRSLSPARGQRLSRHAWTPRPKARVARLPRVPGEALVVVVGTAARMERRPQAGVAATLRPTGCMSTCGMPIRRGCTRWVVGGADVSLICFYVIVDVSASERAMLRRW